MKSAVCTVGDDACWCDNADVHKCGNATQNAEQR